LQKIKHYDGLPQERKTQELPLLQRISSSEIEAQINASEFQVTDRLRESGLRSPIAAKKPLLKDTKKKRLA
jgi:hypothetical protein